jgi:hypothetical protein
VLGSRLGAEAVHDRLGHRTEVSNA